MASIQKIGWYPFKISSYKKHTNFLSPLQHGVYLLLRNYYFQHNHVPSSGNMVYQICKASSDYEKTAVDDVLKFYFKQQGQKYVNEQIEAEIEKICTSREEASQEYMKKCVGGGGE